MIFRFSRRITETGHEQGPFWQALSDQGSDFSAVAMIPCDPSTYLIVGQCRRIKPTARIGCVTEQELTRVYGGRLYVSWQWCLPSGGVTAACHTVSTSLHIVSKDYCYSGRHKITLTLTSVQKIPCFGWYRVNLVQYFDGIGKTGKSNVLRVKSLVLWNCNRKMHSSDYVPVSL